MPAIPIETLEDPRVEPYRDLKLRNLQRGGEFFIAEGKKVVERLLDSDYETASVFVSERHLEEWRGKVPPTVPLYFATQPVMNELVGFDFHVGVIGCGVRRPSTSLEQVLPALVLPVQVLPVQVLPIPVLPVQVLPAAAPRFTVVVCPNCDNPENLGAIIRISAAFGVDALLLGRGCADPFSRRVIRVSMGTAFKLPILEAADLATDLLRLRQDWHFELAATVLEEGAERLEQAARSARFGILLGNEDTGLGENWTQLCSRKLTIPMCRGTDSLNVAVTAGIMLHHFTREGVSPASASS